MRFRVIDNRTSISQKLKNMEEDLEFFRDEFLRGMAMNVVLESPVDTGAYMDGHHIGAGRGTGGEFTTSYGRERGQNYQPYADAAVDRMFAEISALPDELDNVSLYNVALHADKVEYVHGYAPYTTTRSRANVIAADAAARAKARS